jgi:hypothetical protein
VVQLKRLEGSSFAGFTGCRLSERGGGCAASNMGEAFVGVKDCLLSDVGGGRAGCDGVGVSGVRGPLADPMESPEFDVATVTDVWTVSGYCGLRKGLSNVCGGSTVRGDLTPGLFFPNFNGAGGLTMSSVDSEGTGLMVLDDGDTIRLVLLAACSACFILLAGILMGSSRAAGLFRTGFTKAVRPLAPFHGSRCGGWSSGSVCAGAGIFPAPCWFVVPRSRSPASICLVFSLRSGYCVSSGCVPGFTVDSLPLSLVVGSPE